MPHDTLPQGCVTVWQWQKMWHNVSNVTQVADGKPNTEQPNRGVRLCSVVFGLVRVFGVRCSELSLLLIEQVLFAQGFEAGNVGLPAIADFGGCFALNNHRADILYAHKFLKKWGEELIPEICFMVGVNDILKVKSFGDNLLTISTSKVYAIAEFIL
mgnify:CR=1 FL=1